MLAASLILPRRADFAASYIYPLINPIFDFSKVSIFTYVAEFILLLFSFDLINLFFLVLTWSGTE